MQQPFKLLQDELPYLKAIPKPYNGTHPQSSNNIILKDNNIINTNTPISAINIPTRDLQGYDSLIPTIVFIAPSMSLSVASYLYANIDNVGVLLCA